MSSRSADSLDVSVWARVHRLCAVLGWLLLLLLPCPARAKPVTVADLDAPRRLESSRPLLHPGAWNDAAGASADDADDDPPAESPAFAAVGGPERSSAAAEELRCRSRTRCIRR